MQRNCTSAKCNPETFSPTYIPIGVAKDPGHPLATPGGRMLTKLREEWVYAVCMLCNVGIC